MNELHLFAGIGGGILGGQLLGHTPICAVELEPYCQKILLQRQRDGALPLFPIWDDVRTFDARPWKGSVHVVCGGFPCQNISVAGKGSGITGKSSGLWNEMARIVTEADPEWVFIENSPALRTRGLSKVLRDLANAGYDAEWDVYGGRHIGCPQLRERMWILARHDLQRMANGRGGVPVASSSGNWGTDGRGGGCDGGGVAKGTITTTVDVSGRRKTGCWKDEPDVGRVANGVPCWVDRLKALGNGQVPKLAAFAFIELKTRFQKGE